MEKGEEFDCAAFRQFVRYAERTTTKRDGFSSAIWPNRFSQGLFQ
jgi:hypothetical protein